MRRKTRIGPSWLMGLLVPLALLLAACSSPAPNFNISLSPTSLTVQQGTSGSTTLTLTPQNGFTGAVSLSLSGAPSGVTLSPTSVTVSGSTPVNQSLTLSVAPSVTPGTYALQVRGAAGSITQRASLSLTVTPPPSFTLSLNPTSLTVQQGASGSTTLTLTPQGGFTGTVSLALVDGSGNPVSGITLSPASVTVSGTSPVTQNLTLAVGSSVTPGTYALQVRGAAGSITQRASLSLTVTPPPSFTLSLNPTSLTAPQEGSAVTALIVTPQNGFQGTISLSLANAPQGISLAPTSVQVSGNNPMGQTLTLSVASYVPAGTYNFQVVGTSGSITKQVGLTLTVTWASRTSGTTNALGGITYGNGLFVAVGGNNTVLTSSDGVNWSKQILTAPCNLSGGVTYGNGLFVAVGGFYYSSSSSPCLFISSDGVTWTLKHLSLGFALKAVAYGNGLFVAVGENNTIITSPDGVTWTLRESGYGSPYTSVTYGNALFVAVINNRFRTSADGINWTVQRNNTGLSPYAVGYGNGYFVAVGYNGAILTSTDGITWIARASGGTDLLAISYGNNKYIAVGVSGTIRASSDGSNWTGQTSGTSNNLRGVAYGNGTFVAVGEDGIILTSP